MDGRRDQDEDEESCEAETSHSGSRFEKVSLPDRLKFEPRLKFPIFFGWRPTTDAVSDVVVVVSRMPLAPSFQNGLPGVRLISMRSRNYALKFTRAGMRTRDLSIQRFWSPDLQVH